MKNSSNKNNKTTQKTSLKTKKPKYDSSTCRHEELIGFLSNRMQFYNKNKKVINPLMWDNAGNAHLSLHDFFGYFSSILTF